MKNAKKRLLSTFMALTMVFGMIPAMTITAAAADLSASGGTLSDGSTYELTSNVDITGVFTVTGTVTVTLNATLDAGNTEADSGEASSGEPVFTVQNGGTLTLTSTTSSGEISDAWYGGVVVEGGGKLIVESGVTFDSCNMLFSADDAGGGGAVQVQQGGEFEMQGGTIQNCSTAPASAAAANGTSGNPNAGGGGVFNAGTFTMSGGTIENCGTTYNMFSSNTYGCMGGGGVFNATTGVFTMSGEDALITDCYNYNASYNSNANGGNAGEYGGGVYNAGTFNMSAGSIEDNDESDTVKGTSHGGGVYNKGIMNLSGGSITGNVSTYQSGISNASGAEINISGNPYVAENNGEGLYLLASTDMINIDGAMTEGAKIYVTYASSSNGVFATSSEKYTNLSKFFTTDSSIYVSYAEEEGDYTYTANEIDDYTCDCGCGADGTDDNTVWTPIMEAQDIDISGNYYLYNDISGELRINNTEEVVNLCLNGKTVTGKINVTTSVDLMNLYGADGKVVGTVYAGKASGFTMTGGTVTELLSGTGNISLAGKVIAPVTLSNGQTITNAGLTTGAQLTVTTTVVVTSSTNQAVATNCDEDDLGYFIIGDTTLTTSAITFNSTDSKIYISDTASPSITPSTSGESTTALSLMEDDFTSQYFKAEASLTNPQDYFSTTYKWYKDTDTTSLSTSETYTIPTDADTDASGTYYCEVSVTNSETGNVETDTQAFTLSITDIAFTGADTVVSTIEDAEYGDTLADIFTYSTAGVTASNGSSDIDGSYTLTINETVYSNTTKDTILDADEDYTYAVTFTSTDSTYEDILVTSGTFDVAQREVTYNSSDLELVYTGSAQVPIVTINNIVGTDDVSITIDDSYKETVAGTNYNAVLTLNDTSGNYNLTTTDVAFSIVQSGSTTDASDSDTTVVYGQSIDLVADVTVGATTRAAASGTTNYVDFYLDADTDVLLGSVEVTYGADGSGSATLSYNTSDRALSVGDNTIYATYNGSVNLNSSDSDTITVKLTAKQVTAAVTTDTITKTYDGGTTATVAWEVATDDIVKTGDAVTVSATATYASANVAESITISFGTPVVGGAQASYYDVTLADNITGAITAKTITSEMITDIDDQVYTGSAITPIVTVTDGSIMTSDDWSYEYSDNTDVGEATVTITAETDGNYTDADPKASTTFDIIQSGTDFGDDDLTVDDADSTYIYGETVTITVTPEATGDAATAVAAVNALYPTEPTAGQMALFDENDVQLCAAVSADASGSYTLTYKTTDKLLAIGDHTITAKYVGTDNMADYSEDFTITIEKKAITTATIATGVTKEYDGNATFSAIDLVLGNDIETGDEVTATATLTRTTANVVDADTFTVTSVSALSGDHAGYYTLVYTAVDDDTNSVDVTAKTITSEMITAIGSQVYTGSDIEPTVTVTDGNIMTDDDWSYEYSDNTDVGEATVTITAETDGNYTDADPKASTTFDIIQSGTEFGDDVFDGVDGETYTYGETMTITVTPEATGVAAAAVAAVNALYPTEPTEGQMALFAADGTQLCEAVSADASGDYVLTYDTTDKLLSIDTHTITAKYVGTDNMADYSETFDIKIEAKAITTATITTGVTKEYDGNATFSAIDLVLGNDIETGDEVTATATLTRTTANVVDADTFTVYSVSDLSGAQAGYYTLVYTAVATTGDVAITAKALTITTLPQEVTYGTAISSETTDVTVVGLITDEELTAITLEESDLNVETSDKTVDVASFVIQNGETTIDNDNYDITYENGALTITTKPIIAVWTDTTTEYDGTAQAPSVSFVGALEVDTIYTSMDSYTAAGSYTVTLSGVNTNYTVTNPSTSFTISKAPVSFTVSNNVVEYTGSAIYATVSNDKGISATITYTNSSGTEVTDPTSVGTYSIYAEFTDTNYRHASTTDGAAIQVGVLTIYTTAPATYDVTFDDGTPAINHSIAGTIHTLPVGADKSETEVFAGWTYNSVTYKAGDSFTQPSKDVAFEAVYSEVHDIHGYVYAYDTETGIEGVVVTLMKGSTQEAYAVTGENGSYTFDNYSAGVYNVVASYDSTTKTELADISLDDADVIITMPQYKTSSVLEVAAGTPDIVVGGLDDIAAALVNENNSTDVAKIILTVEQTSVTVDAIEEAASNVGLYLNIDVTQTVNDETSDVTDTGTQLIEFIIPIPADYQNKASYTIYREHEGDIHEITTTANSDGEYLEVSEDKTSLTLHVCKFSTYALAYTEYSTSSGTATYSSSVASADNGDVSISASKSKMNATVTITTDPDAGYEVGDVTVTYSSGREVTVTDNGDGTYSYKQPGASVTVTVTFVESDGADSDFFTDVDEDAYYYDAIKWAVENDITNGTTDTTFSPDATCTRAQAVTLLWKAYGSPVVDYVNPFTDVDADSYYYEAVLWAVSEGITSGTSDTTFSPNADCTRGQIVTFLYRAAGEPEVSSDSTFADVNNDSYCYDAVLWAVSEGITNGTSDTTFSPNTNCTRGQIVTFLYRNMGE
ncbi:S-layer homology domain-containing protein [Bengtsoniella intestinalis]|uniref:S-layer homology domain-containing protein n=1 Tax=Bengtsoniella intestinalis TaxID=3073143 RepID=UPI00391FB289